MTISRRGFLGRAAAAAGAAPHILPFRGRAAEPGPNGLVNMAFVGIGAQNRTLLGNFLWRNIKVVAVCDVDKNRREHAKSTVKEFHDAHPEKGAFACEAYGDHREIMARKDVDAVCIATPDHWHALITLDALKAGKDVYCEKPLTHNIREAIEVMAAAQRHGRVVQTGSMQRSMGEFRVACELVRNGVIGKLESVRCMVVGLARPCDLPEEPMEAGLDWERWLGPAPVRPYNSQLCPRGVHGGFPPWRNYREYGGGSITDFGAHHFDIAQWGLGADESGPLEVRPPENPSADVGAVAVFEGGIPLQQVGRGDKMRWNGVKFFGSEGTVEADRGQFELVLGGKSITNAGLAERDFLKDAKIRLYRSSSHTDDFLARVADRKRPVASEIEGGHTAILCHLINQAYFNRRTIRWDPRKLAFADSSGEPAWMTRDYRKPWTLE